LSYNLAVVIPPISSNDGEAWKMLDALIDEQGPTPSVFQELHDRLTAKYPCMCSVPDDQIDDTVWSDGPLIDNFQHRAAVLGMSYSRVDEVLPFIIETANALGLVVFDWATKSVHRPQSASATKATTRQTVVGWIQSLLRFIRKTLSGR
jgi:hypothetical protein